MDQFEKAKKIQERFFKLHIEINEGDPYFDGENNNLCWIPNQTLIINSIKLNPQLPLMKLFIITHYERILRYSNDIVNKYYYHSRNLDKEYPYHSLHKEIIWPHCIRFFVEDPEILLLFKDNRVKESETNIKALLLEDFKIQKDDSESNDESDNESESWSDNGYDGFHERHVR